MEHERGLGFQEDRRRIVVVQHHGVAGRALARHLRPHYARVDVTTDPFAVSGLLADEGPVDLITGMLFGDGHQSATSWVETWRAAAPWLERVVVISSEPPERAPGVDACFRKPDDVAAVVRFLTASPLEVAS